MEKISAFLVILFLVSSYEDCVKKYGRCKVTGDLPVCLHYYCSCYHEMHTPSLTTSNS
ncbi:unnamed protein product [Brassica oleracea var. botrytis]|uniref:BnaC01g38780D protein n=2 Tax=Brassica TaxID=3705 RepID=A0A078GC01_BRANA|nr:BnaC01g38780D [Brassica napus]